MSRIRRHMTYANVAATLALLIALGGSTVAIAGNNAPKNSVTSRSIKPFNVTARNLSGTRLVQTSGQFSAFASCREHERLIGGGGSSPPGDNLGASRPGGNGWFAQQGTGPETHVIAYAICLKAKPGK